MTITAEQRARRAHSIGGSDAPAIVGASPWKTPLALWLDKVEPEQQEMLDSLPMRIGTALEPVILEQFERETGMLVETCEDTLTDIEHPFLTGHIDGIVVDNGPRHGVEAKWVSMPSDEWGVPGSDQVPPHVFIQCLHYMMVTGWHQWHVAVLFGSRDFRTYTIGRDEKMILALRKHELEFWQLVQERIAPPMSAPADARLLFKRDDGSAKIASPEIESEIERWKHCKREEKAYAEMCDNIAIRVQAFLGESATLLDHDGKPLATWKAGKPPERFDTKAFKQANPELHAQFIRTGDPVRRFLVK